MAQKFHLAIIGVGLIGGSFGLAMKASFGDDIYITGLCRSQQSMDNAVSCGAVDSASPDVEKVVKDADVVYLSTPVLQIVPMTKKILPYLKSGAVVTDAGSTKEYLWNELSRLLPKDIYYVSGHPMTGKEKSGVTAADKNLFRHKCYVVLEETTAPKDVYDKVVDLFRRTGARLTTLDAKKHDRCASLISHVPHVTAAALVNILGLYDDDMNAVMKLAGGGFKDTTRIASSNSDMWADICMTNGALISKHLRELKKIIGDIADAGDAHDRQAVYDYFAAAKKRRDAILDYTEPYFDI